MVKAVKLQEEYRRHLNRRNSSYAKAISIVGGMIITALIFMGFNYFKDIVKKEMTKSRLKKAWSLHFPFFDYEEYANKVNEIFEEAMREEVSKRDLQKYILDRLTNI